MDQLLYSFIINNYIDEMQYEINKSILILENYGYDIQSKLLNIVSSESYVSTENMIDKVTLTIIEGLNFVLKEHKIILIDEATINERNEFLTALNTIQNLENYEPIISLLETLESNEHKLSLIISDFSYFNQVDVMRLVEYFDPIILTILKNYIIEREPNEILEVNSDISNNLKVFLKFYNSEIANEISSVLLIGNTFPLYLNFFKSDIDSEDIDGKLKIIITLLYMSEDGYNNPLETFRNYSSLIYSDLNMINQLEVLLINTINAFNEFKDAFHEKNRLSEASN